MTDDFIIARVHTQILVCLKPYLSTNMHYMNCNFFADKWPFVGHFILVHLFFINCVAISLDNFFLPEKVKPKVIFLAKKALFTPKINILHEFFVQNLR